MSRSISSAGTGGARVLGPAQRQHAEHAIEVVERVADQRGVGLADLAADPSPRSSRAPGRTCTPSAPGTFRSLAIMRAELVARRADALGDRRVRRAAA